MYSSCSASYSPMRWGQSRSLFSAIRRTCFRSQEPERVSDPQKPRVTLIRTHEWPRFSSFSFSVFIFLSMTKSFSWHSRYQEEHARGKVPCITQAVTTVRDNQKVELKVQDPSALHCSLVDGIASLLHGSCLSKSASPREKCLLAFIARSYFCFFSHYWEVV